MNETVLIHCCGAVSRIEIWLPPVEAAARAEAVERLRSSGEV